MLDLFSTDKLTENAHKEINFAREWLNRIEQDLNEPNACVNAALLLDLGNCYVKLSYGIGMLNKSKLAEREGR